MGFSQKGFAFRGVEVPEEIERHVEIAVAQRCHDRRSDLLAADETAIESRRRKFPR